MENGRCSRHLLSLSASPNEFSPGEAVGEGPSPTPGTRLDAGAHNPWRAALGIPICQSVSCCSEPCSRRQPLNAGHRTGGS